MVEGLCSEPSTVTQPPPHPPACREKHTLPTAGRGVLSPWIISWLAPRWKKIEAMVVYVHTRLPPFLFYPSRQREGAL